MNSPNFLKTGGFEITPLVLQSSTGLNIFPKVSKCTEEQAMEIASMIQN